MDGKLTAQQVTEVKALAVRAAAVFVTEFGVPLVQEETDWDSEAWAIDAHKTFLGGDLLDAAWEVYRSALIAETERLCSEAR